MIVDENEPTVQSLTELLEARGFKVIGACSSAEYVRKAISEQPDMIIIDAALSGDGSIMQSLRFERGLENIIFVVLGKETDGTATLMKV